MAPDHSGAAPRRTLNHPKIPEAPKEPIMPNNNAGQVSTRDLAADLTVHLDGHVIENYFGDGSAVSYETRLRPSGDSVDLDVIDANGNIHTFVLEITDAG